ncbi:type II secretion system F family protein [Rhabdochromatium marinum]|uniref:type II secretion system F family protein n=1 Tax=Rhabdochromatium marinum TaxID=48729 RepID=UPI001905AB20|nr:type II secretion system F family protein [Rhabdochromatium marinum]MBK1649609.1 hypothetical protein [Rhabdochromatium marinum]
MTDHRWLADLFARLAALEQAGIAPQQAFTTVAQGAPAPVKAALERAARWCGGGVAVAKSATRAGLIDALDARVLEAATESGRLESAYQALAKRHAAADRWGRQVRSKLLLPGFILVVALFVQPLPALFTGDLDLLGYLRASLGVLALMAGGFWSLLVLIRRLRGTALGIAVGSWLLRLPGLDRVLIRRQRTLYLEALAMLFAAGVPLLSALEQAARTLPPGPVRTAYRHLHQQVEAGATLEQAFAVCGYISKYSTLLVRAAEVSGTLEETFERLARGERESLETLEDELASWLPRLVYLVLAGWMAFSIVAGGPLTSMPGEQLTVALFIAKGFYNYAI